MDVGQGSADGSKGPVHASSASSHGVVESGDSAEGRDAGGAWSPTAVRLHAAHTWPPLGTLARAAWPVKASGYVPARGGSADGDSKWSVGLGSKGAVDTVGCTVVGKDEGDAPSHEGGRSVSVRVLDLDGVRQMDLVKVIRAVRRRGWVSHPNVTPLGASFLHGRQLWVCSPMPLRGSLLARLGVAFPHGITGSSCVATVLRDVLQGLAALHGTVDCGAAAPVGAAHVVLLPGTRCCCLGELVPVCGFPLLESVGVSGPAGEAGADGADVWTSPEEMVLNRGFSQPAGSIWKEEGRVGSAGERRAAHEADVWRVGMLALELAFGPRPFAEGDPLGELSDNVKRSGAGSPAGPGVRSSLAFIEFVALCCQKNPRLRPTCEDLLGHDFIQHFADFADNSLVLQPLFNAAVPEEEGSPPFASLRGLEARQAREASKQRYAAKLAAMCAPGAPELFDLSAFSARSPRAGPGEKSERRRVTFVEESNAEVPRQAATKMLDPARAAAAPVLQKTMAPPPVAAVSLVVGAHVLGTVAETQPSIACLEVARLVDEASPRAPIQGASGKLSPSAAMHQQAQQQNQGFNPGPSDAGNVGAPQVSQAPDARPAGVGRSASHTGLMRSDSSKGRFQILEENQAEPHVPVSPPLTEHGGQVQHGPSAPPPQKKQGEIQRKGRFNILKDFDTSKSDRTLQREGTSSQSGNMIQRSSSMAHLYSSATSPLLMSGGLVGGQVAASNAANQAAMQASLATLLEMQAKQAEMIQSIIPGMQLALGQQPAAGGSVTPPPVPHQGTAADALQELTKCEYSSPAERDLIEAFTELQRKLADLVQENQTLRKRNTHLERELNARTRIELEHKKLEKKKLSEARRKEKEAAVEHEKAARKAEHDKATAEGAGQQASSVNGTTSASAATKPPPSAAPQQQQSQQPQPQPQPQPGPAAPGPSATGSTPGSTPAVPTASDPIQPLLKRQPSYSQVGDRQLRNMMDMGVADIPKRPPAEPPV